MSLFTAKGSSGIGCAFALGPGMPCARSVICTSAESPFVKTLRTTAVSCLVRESSSDSEASLSWVFGLEGRLWDDSALTSSSESASQLSLTSSSLAAAASQSSSTSLSGFALAALAASSAAAASLAAFSSASFAAASAWSLARSAASAKAFSSSTYGRLQVNF